MTLDLDIEDIFIEAEKVAFRRDEHGEVWVTLGDGPAQRLGGCISAFPLTHPHQLVAIRDEQGEDLAMLDDVDRLDEASHAIVSEELERTYFMPWIQDILDIDEHLNVVEWEVVTDKGERTFQVRNVRQNVRRVGRRQFVIKDVDGNRYEISDWMALPAAAQKLLEGYL